MTQKCNALPMVEWDRTVEVAGAFGDSTHYAVVYGWIHDPEKDRHDFVALQFWWDPEAGSTFLTSSAQWSETINNILTPDEEHHVCETVQANLPGLTRKVQRSIQ
jgi:hypothetical protein